MSLVRAIATVGGFTLVSRVTGFVRDILIAALLGAGPVADAFFVAFKLPNFFRRLTGEGALTVAFVPMFAGTLEADGRKAAVDFAAEVQAVLLAVLLAFLLAIEVAMPWAMLVLAPGFADEPERFGLAVELTRITFPYLPLISLVALWGGILNSLDRFWAMAAAPILLNLVLIAALVLAAGRTETPGHALAWGVALAGVGQALFLAEVCRREGVLPRLRRPRLTPEVRRLLKLMLPAALGAGVVQVNLLVDVVLASLLPAGSVSFLYYADRVVQLPLGVVGVAIGTALLPMLARQVRSGNETEAAGTQNRAIEMGLLLTLPAAAALLVIADPLTAVLFERGRFAAADGDATAAAMAAFAAGLPAFVLIKAFQPGFFARRDTATPVKVAVVGVLANLAFNLVLMPLFAHVGIALATTLAAWLNAGLLGWLLMRRGHFRPDARLRRRALRIAAAAAAMAAALWAAVRGLEPWLTAGSAEGVAALAAVIAVGLTVYAVVGTVLGAARPSELKAALRRRG
ncbi:MAG: murein biosynthesis integral membrane protein MurJ [Thalassobaculum sp.]|uniref:murein biosynthesis integral membrane protein MurJ n=1 Tax=Thalassobaculum sp. TaxID=2022740 RepID=UPI0032EB5319